MISIKECEEKRLLSMLAAFVDGEGNIGIKRTKTPSGNFSYRQRLSVGNTDIRLINWIVENFWGRVPKPIKNKGNRKDNHIWEINGIHSYKLIKKIQPYLILKQEQADCAIELYEKVTDRVGKSNPIRGWKKQRAEELFDRCKEINKVGREDNNDVEVRVIIKRNRKVLEEWIDEEEEE